MRALRFYSPNPSQSSIPSSHRSAHIPSVTHKGLYKGHNYSYLAIQLGDGESGTCLTDKDAIEVRVTTQL